MNINAQRNKYRMESNANELLFKTSCARRPFLTHKITAQDVFATLSLFIHTALFYAESAVCTINLCKEKGLATPSPCAIHAKDDSRYDGDCSASNALGFSVRRDCDNARGVFMVRSVAISARANCVNPKKELIGSLRSNGKVEYRGTQRELAWQSRP